MTARAKQAQLLAHFFRIRKSLCLLLMGISVVPLHLLSVRSPAQSAHQCVFPLIYM